MYAEDFSKSKLANRERVSPTPEQNRNFSKLYQVLNDNIEQTDKLIEKGHRDHIHVNNAFMSNNKLFVMCSNGKVMVMNMPLTAY